MKTPRLCLVLTVLALAFVPSLPAQSRGNLRELIFRINVRTPLEATTTVTRPTPAGPVTVAVDNSFSNGAGTFSTVVTLPNGNTASVGGTITATPATGINVSGTVTGPGGQEIDFTNTAMPSSGGITITSSVTPPSGNTQTRTTTVTPPMNNDDDEDGSMLARMIKRLRMPLIPRD